MKDTSSDLHVRRVVLSLALLLPASRPDIVTAEVIVAAGPGGGTVNISSLSPCSPFTATTAALFATTRSKSYLQTTDFTYDALGRRIEELRYFDAFDRLVVVPPADAT